MWSEHLCRAVAACARCSHLSELMWGLLSWCGGPCSAGVLCPLWLSLFLLPLPHWKSLSVPVHKQCCCPFAFRPHASLLVSKAFSVFTYWGISTFRSGILIRSDWNYGWERVVLDWKKRLSNREHLLLFQKTWVLFPEPIRKLTSTYNSWFWGAAAPFWLNTHMCRYTFIYTYIYMQTYICIYTHTDMQTLNLKTTIGLERWPYR